MSERFGSVLLLTGPPGVGKTTVARLVAERVERSVHLESDEYFHEIRSGYIDPWKPESHEQNVVVMQVVSDAAATFAKAGYFTIVEGILLPGWFYEPVRDRLQGEGLEVGTVILQAPLDVCVSRASHRDPGPAWSRAVLTSRPLGDPVMIEKLWNGFQDLGALETQALDTDGAEPETTAEMVAQRLRLDVAY